MICIWLSLPWNPEGFETLPKGLQSPVPSSGEARVASNKMGWDTDTSSLHWRKFQSCKCGIMTYGDSFQQQGQPNEWFFRKSGDGIEIYCYELWEICQTRCWVFWCCEANFSWTGCGKLLSEGDELLPAIFFDNQGLPWSKALNPQFSHCNSSAHIRSAKNNSCDFLFLVLQQWYGTSAYGFSKPQGSSDRSMRRCFRLPPSVLPPLQLEHPRSPRSWRPFFGGEKADWKFDDFFLGKLEKMIQWDGYRLDIEGLVKY